MTPEWIIQQLIDIVKGSLIAIIGFYICFKYLIPKMSRDTAVATVKAFLEHPEIKPSITKFKKLEPILEKIKDLDLQELVDLAKGVKVFIELQTNQKPPPPPPKARDK